MNTNKLKSFAQSARRILMEGVSRRITYYGFDAKGKVIDEPIAVPGGAIIREEVIDDATVPAKWQALRTAIQRHGVDAVVEEAAYTWFNRMMAMRILAKNNYDPSQLEYESEGSLTPVILARARRGMISYLDRTEQHRVQPLLGDYRNEQKAFSILLTGYCHHHQLLNRIFGRLDDYTELLLPDNILAESGFIHLLNTTDAIAAEDYRQVELIGWLYQFYISEKKDQVFASFKKNKKAEAEDIPAATQIFTPNWIVKYMVQNTVGRIWLDHRPESPLKKKMKYLVESQSPPLIPPEGGGFFPPPGEQEGGFGVESLKLLDPACGSGHILVEGFFHLYDIYEEEYYMPTEAVEKILQHNLFGLDIDLRAAQLAQFAVLLAAATKYPDILKKEIAPHIYAMPEAATFSHDEILDFLGSEGTQHEKVLTRALELMQQAKNLGSVMQFNVTPAERQFFLQRLETLKAEAKTSLLAQSLLNKIQPFLQVLFILTDRYEAIAANPPYMGSGNMNNDLKNYVNKNYSASKSDLMTVFMESIPALTKINGRWSMINLPSWLFLSSFEELRKQYINNYHLESLIHMGRGIFGIDFGSVAFTIKKKFIENGFGNYFRLHERNFQHIYFGDIEKLFLYSNGNPDYKYDFGLYRDEEGITEIPKAGTIEGLKLYYPNISQSTFSKIPGSPIAYWVTAQLINAYKRGNLIGKVCETKQGLATGNNSEFIFSWYELNFKNIGFGYRSVEQAISSQRKFQPLVKGGPFRKWFGNFEAMIKFDSQAYNKLLCQGNKLPSKEYYFKETIEWSRISSGNISLRYVANGFAFDGASAFVDSKSENLFFIAAFLNSKVAISFLQVIAPTFNFQSGDIKRIPLIISEDFQPKVNKLVSETINISKDDWDDREISWDFKTNFLFNTPVGDFGVTTMQFTHLQPHTALWVGMSLQKAYTEYLVKRSTLFYRLHQNEEELNRIFIDIYGLNEELDPLIPLKDITILQEELDRNALEETDKELRKHRQWKLEEGKWQLYIDGQLQPVPAEGELPVPTVMPPLPIKKEVVMQQLISYAVGCMMGRYSLDAPGLILANQGETIDDYKAKVERQKAKNGEDNSQSGPVVSPLRGDGRGAESCLSFLPDDDGIIPLMGSNCGFSDDAVLRLRHFIEAVWGSETLTQNINFLQACLDMEIEKYLVNQNNFWKDHCSRYKKKPIYWLFSSKKGAFQVLTYMHRMNRFTVQKIRDNYMLKHLQWLANQKADLERRSATLSRDETRQLDYYRTALNECQEYDMQLKHIADQQIEFDLDDGVTVNYAKFAPLLAAIK